MSQFILALDQGTTSSRAMLFDHSGHVKGIAQKEFRQHYPKPGLVEHDPEEIWSSQEEVALQVLSEAGLAASDVAAIGITNQRETTLVWDRSTGRPVYPAIVWQDRRTASICERLTEEGKLELFQSKTGLLLDAYFSGPKVQWILDHVEGARERAEKGELAFGTIDSWLLWKLTGGKSHLTDITNASRTLLFDIYEKKWSEELAKILEVPLSMCPEVRPSSGEIATVHYGSALDGLPVAGLAGDQQAALFGQTCFETGMAKNTYGTGCFVLMNTGESPVPSKNQLVTTVAWQIGDRTEYALEGSIFIAGALVQWLRDELGLIKNAAEIEALAEKVSDSGGVYVVPAFTGLGAPHWDPHARWAILGLTRGSSAAHIARAALEAIAFQTVDVLQAMQSDSGIPLKELRVDGGASNNNLLMQIQADLLQVPVRRPDVTETTALGAAYLAGLAVGYWNDKEEIARQWNENRLFTPQSASANNAALLRGWNRALKRTQAWEEEPET